jgi:hypothetical protein
MTKSDNQHPTGDEQQQFAIRAHRGVGFPAGNFKKRLWPVVEEFGIPYVVALGTQADGHTVFVSDHSVGNASVMASVTDQIVSQVIDQLRQRGDLNKAAGTYSFGPYKTFTVREKKFRHVVDAPMKDRVVHWMLYQHLLPIWQPRFIHDTYGNLPCRGTHAAINRLAQFCRAQDAKWALLRKLITALIDSFKTDGQFDDLFAPDSMYRRTWAKGMPIGNLSSQLLANIFLCDFDHWVKETLRVNRYIRYVDDMVIVAATQDELLDIRAAIVGKLAADGLTIHPHKMRLAPAHMKKRLEIA